jgi:hypothetical protein
MKVTVNQINQKLSEIATAHKQIHSYFWGDFMRAFKERELNYPLMCCYITPTVIFNKTVSTVPINILVCDKIYKDWSNLNDVESDMLDLANQLYQIIRLHPKWQELGTVVSCNIPTKFIDQGGDEVAGFVMTVNFKFISDVCFDNLPLENY